MEKKPTKAGTLDWSKARSKAEKEKEKADELRARAETEAKEARAKREKDKEEKEKERPKTKPVEVKSAKVGLLSSPPLRYGLTQLIERCEAKDWRSRSIRLRAVGKTPFARASKGCKAQGKGYRLG